MGADRSAATLPLEARLRYLGANEWHVIDPVDGAIIAVRYSAGEAQGLADGYNLGARAQHGVDHAEK